LYDAGKIVGKANDIIDAKGIRRVTNSRCLPDHSSVLEKRIIEEEKIKATIERKRQKNFARCGRN
jgi:hypothetical protein